MEVCISQKLISICVYATTWESTHGGTVAVLCAVAGYAGAEQGKRVDSELGSARRLGEKRSPVGMGRGAMH